jgi:hypothetical protein
LTVLPRPSPVHEFFRVWARLTWSFQHHDCLSWKKTLVPSLHLICCSYNFPLRHPVLDAVAVRLHSLENSRQKVSWSSSTFWLLLRRQLSSWWEIPSLPSMIFVIINNILDFLSPWTCPCCGCNLLPSLYVLPWSITVFYVEDVVRIAPPLRNSWHSDTSHHHHSSLVPMLILTRIPICKRCCLDCVLLTTLLLWS